MHQEHHVTDHLLIKRQNDITHLIMNRPDKANALSAALVEEMLEAVEKASSDGTRLLVFSGNGSSFCAGFDFTGIDTESDATLAVRLIRIETLLQAVYHVSMPTIALAHGGVYGAGADLACVCARRVAAPGTRFRMPGLGFGIALGTQRFAERVGSSVARAILSETRMFDADEALRIGFVDAIIAQEGWSAVIEAAAKAARTLDPASVALLHELTVRDTRAADMAALARSATRPGLKERMVKYRAAATKR